MNVPTYTQEQIVKEDRNPTDAFASFLRNLLQNMQLSISDEGYWIPSVTSQPGSNVGVPDNKLAVLQDSFQSPTAPVDSNTQTVSTGVQPGTIIFDPWEVNGAVLPARNGQLKVLLNDGTFHNIVNT